MGRDAPLPGHARNRAGSHPKKLRNFLYRHKWLGRHRYPSHRSSSAEIASSPTNLRFIDWQYSSLLSINIARLPKRSAATPVVPLPANGSKTNRSPANRNRRAFAVRSVAGRPAKKTDGPVAAETNGTRSTREACVPSASTSGLRPNASLAATGRRTRIGMRSEELQFRRVASTVRRSAPSHRDTWSLDQDHRRQSQPRIRCCSRSDNCSE